MSKGAPGRPRKPPHLIMTRRLQLSLTEQTWGQILLLAEQEEMYVADYVRMVLKEHIKMTWS